ncbi:uncharacterized protein FIBRA_00701 [Fibroporia radiculosa]|uniref:Histone chaperone domain-containing protein n=1 Tax=Fibroporia radiculosa TaxID=599839 RepID=J4HS17_9APHY|nr:uncharacterized protein FIBRA_00701 [Fibroporia radiculosa]CCL98697.1 predicted protein [Fibroporia radiculosa]
MSTEATSTGAPNADTHPTGPTHAPVDKGKAKFVKQVAMDDDDDEEEEDDDEEDEDDDMEEARDELHEIDPSAIIGTRRTRGVRVDYTSAAALEKAGLKPEAADDDEGEESFVAKDDEMHDD